MVILTIYIIFLVLGFALLFGGLSAKNLYMVYSGAVLLMIIGTVGWQEDVQYQSGMTSVLNGSTTTVTNTYTSINNWSFEAFNVLCFLVGMFGMFFPYIKGSKRSEKAVDPEVKEHD